MNRPKRAQDRDSGAPAVPPASARSSRCGRRAATLRPTATGSRTRASTGYKPATVARKLAVVSSYYTRARKEGLIELSPALDLDRPDVSRESARLGLAPNDAARLLAVADRAPPLERALVWLLHSNGLRISEALGADVSDLRQEGGHPLLRVPRTGHDGGYDAPLNAETAAALSELAGARPGSDPLFLSPAPGSHNARRLDRLAALRIIRRLARRAGVSTELRPHEYADLLVMPTSARKSSQIGLIAA